MPPGACSAGSCSLGVLDAEDQIAATGGVWRARFVDRDALKRPDLRAADAAMTLVVIRFCHMATEVRSTPVA
jgi:hypothetical protein